jgi:hypothetical protein
MVTLRYFALLPATAGKFDELLDLRVDAPFE